MAVCAFRNASVRDRPYKLYDTMPACVKTSFEFERFKCISQSGEQNECSVVRHPKSGTTAKFKVLGMFESKVLDGSAPISGDRRRSHAHDANPFLAFLSVLVTKI